MDVLKTIGLVALGVGLVVVVALILLGVGVFEAVNRDDPYKDKDKDKKP